MSQQIKHIELGNEMVGAVVLPALQTDHAEWVVMNDKNGRLVAAGKARDAEHAEHLMRVRLSYIEGAKKAA